ncbi:Wadjet anti-phage system protein JetD domain-containing protein [Psychromonas sp.]|uniref:Wadjet anti-phage system protein JetD domain-containing protein n=1 Tax=Psychromonas sp. TaxID=1884585 RepID=UPI003565AD39
MLESKAIKAKLQKQWQQFKFHQAYLNNEQIFPYQIKLPRQSDQRLLHNFTQVQQWVLDLEQGYARVSGVTLIKQEISYSKMGRQRMPVALEFSDLASLAKYLGQWQAWQQFEHAAEKIITALPELLEWLRKNPAQVQKYLGVWRELIAVCQFFKTTARPDCYIRELAIPGVDSKFIEAHKAILKILLDQLLAVEAIASQYTKLSEHGFEKRFGLKYEQPLLRFRLLDPVLQAELGGLSDLSIPIAQFAKLDLLLDRVFITENKVNGLAFPEIKNSIVIFGLGYGVQCLKQIKWLSECHIHYWGDIDTHGFAILSQLRGYFPKVVSMLMDQQTLINCRKLWGEEAENKAHTCHQLAHLTEAEQLLYQRLKNAYWQPGLRLEQERIPFSLLEEKLHSLM